MRAEDYIYTRVCLAEPNLPPFWHVRTYARTHVRTYARERAPLSCFRSSATHCAQGVLRQLGDGQPAPSSRSL